MTILEIKNKSKKREKTLVVSWSGTARQLKRILNLRK